MSGAAFIFTTLLCSMRNVTLFSCGEVNVYPWFAQLLFDVILINCKVSVCFCSGMRFIRAVTIIGWPV